MIGGVGVPQLGPPGQQAPRRQHGCEQEKTLLTINSVNRQITAGNAAEAGGAALPPTHAANCVALLGGG